MNDILRNYALLIVCAADSTIISVGDFYKEQDEYGHVV